MIYKIFLLIFFTVFCSASYSQTMVVQDDFEGNGTITSWFGDECEIDNKFLNPFQQGINTSLTVLKYVDYGGQYANVRFDIPNNFDLQTHYTFSLKIYVPSNGLTGNQNNQLSIKLQDGTIGAPWSTQSELIKPITVDQWQEVSFDFKNENYINLDPGSDPPTQRTDFNRIVIQVNGENNNDHVLAYIDDFIYYGTIAADPAFDNLVWSDEFDGSGDIDHDKWFRQYQLPNGGSWYNGEVQHYTDRTDNSFVENGILKIVAKKETYTNQGVTKNYTSARLNSKFAFTYGKIEIRAKLPTGIGTWPAIWMLGKNINEDGAYWDNEGFGTTPWPACGEIDIMEHWGNNQNYVQSATHTPSSYGSTINLGGQTIPTASTDFHTYTLQWTADKLVFSIDDVIHYTYKPIIKDDSTWPFDLEQYLILNVAIQGNIDSNFQEGALEIDYIRVYQQGTPTSVEEVTQNNTTHIYPNPISQQMNIVVDNALDQNIKIRIYNTSGRLINTYSRLLQNDKVTIDNIGFLPKGIYLIQVEYDNQQQCLKVIKQ